MKLTLIQPFHSLFYAPQFVALHLGCLADEGFDAEVVMATPALSPIRALAAGVAEIALGGIMRSLEVVDRGGRRFPHFAEVNSRNGFFLLSRTARPRFAWSDLAGATVISFAGAPTPYQCMLTVLRRHGVDPARVTFVRDLHGEDAVAAFRAGRGEFLEAGQPTTELLLDEGTHLVASMGEATGPVPFSSYMTTADRLGRDPALIVAFTRAVARAQRWMAGHGAADIAEVVAPSFPDVAPALRARVIERYQSQGTWATNPRLGRPGYEALHDILLAGGFIRRRHRYEEVVDPGPAERALDTLKEPG